MAPNSPAPNHPESTKVRISSNIYVAPGQEAASAFALPGAVAVPLYTLNPGKNSYYLPITKERIGHVERGDKVQLLVMAPQGSYPVVIEGRVLRIYKNVVQVYIPYRLYKPVIDQALAGGGFLYIIRIAKIPKLAPEGGV
jgi:hypothetical protein